MSPTDVNQGADHITDLLVEKPIALHIDTHFAKAAFDITAVDRANRGEPWRPLASHGRKIMLPDEVPGGLAHRALVQMMPVVIHVTLGLSFHGTTGSIVYSIAVQLTDRAACGVKIAPNLPEVDDGQVFGKSRANRMSESIRNQFIGCEKGAYVPGRMHPSVRSAAARQSDLVPDGAPDGLFKHALNSAEFGLILPAIKPRTVVGYVHRDCTDHAVDRIPCSGSNKVGIPWLVFCRFHALPA